MYTRKEDKGVQIPPLEAFAIFLVNAVLLEIKELFAQSPRFTHTRRGLGTREQYIPSRHP